MPRRQPLSRKTKISHNQSHWTNITLEVSRSTQTNQRWPPTSQLPKEYTQHKKVFSEEQSQRLLKHTIWDHAIKLLPNAPVTLPAQLIPLNLKERKEMHNFVAEHLKRGTIWELKSPYTASFFFIKKKDGKLQPVQDYRPINKWTKKNRNVSPLIP